MNLTVNFKYKARIKYLETLRVQFENNVMKLIVVDNTCNNHDSFSIVVKVRYFMNIAS